MLSMASGSTPGICCFEAIKALLETNGFRFGEARQELAGRLRADSNRGVPQSSVVGRSSEPADQCRWNVVLAITCHSGVDPVSCPIVWKV